jgi:hypothetical protein
MQAFHKLIANLLGDGPIQVKQYRSPNEYDIELWCRFARVAATDTFV